MRSAKTTLLLNSTKLLEAIVKQYSDHPQTLPLLQDRATNDPDEKLREWEKWKLQRLENS
ncbi:hypothetical protein [Hydrocoleum sp. CS-953]|uniref:hypothetical protein n=1 Tax=Microcoleaceae TaxID=1892252 RepID=UPI000B9A9F8A|nr:hypothetical protein [Hydrocoleum sp. CS-953]OZH53918.1 hypothetical protein AFK68_14310 [Hydrocoleum sp. CS-953]